MDSNKHLCNRCVFQDPNVSPPCTVAAPASRKALRAETVTLCSLFSDKNDGRKSLQEGKWPR